MKYKKTTHLEDKKLESFTLDHPPTPQNYTQHSKRKNCMRVRWRSSTKKLQHHPQHTSSP